MSDVTRILDRIEKGDSNAATELLPLVYEQLRHLAASKMAQEAPGHTLQPTALVHEAWLRLAGNQEQHWNGRNHFFMAAAEAMRRILVERARQKSRLKRGGGQQRVPLEELELAIHADSETLLLVEEALERLKAADPVKARLVITHIFFGHFSDLLMVSHKIPWKSAKSSAWLTSGKPVIRAAGRSWRWMLLPGSRATEALNGEIPCKLRFHNQLRLTNSYEDVGNDKPPRRG